MANSTAKYTHQGELFALMNLGKDVSEDTSAGRLILNNCTTVLIAAAAGQRQKDLKGFFFFFKYLKNLFFFFFFFFFFFTKLAFILCIGIYEIFV